MVPASVPPVPTAETKAVTSPGGLLPDFRASGAIMRETVGGVVELIGPEPALFLRHPPGDMVVVPRIGIGFLRHGEDLRTQRAKEVDFFPRLVFGNDNDGMVTPCVADNREADTRIPCRTFNDGAAGLAATLWSRHPE